MDQFDRTLLRSFFTFGRAFERIDGALLNATDQQLSDSLACLDESEFEKFRPLNLRPKIEAVLRQRVAQEAKQLVAQEEQKRMVADRVLSRRAWAAIVLSAASLLLSLLKFFR